ncbi:hypothetical protein [Pedobacter sp. UC225_65]|uniref:hypothetical protein n=1 Tax=Pedobacter sp. UC225_65 TaxID=3350173 RepID=UPI0036719469
MKTNTYSEIKGSPFLTENWAQGNVKFVNGRVLTNIALKYDQVKDELLFKGKDNEEYYFSDLISEFDISYAKTQGDVKQRFINGFTPSKNLTEKSFYEVLVDGKVRLLKRSNKTITETKEYNAATSVKEINENVAYYIGKAGDAAPLKKNDIKTVASLIDAQKSAAIIDYANKNNVNPKTEIGLRQIVNYYNSL